MHHLKRRIVLSAFLAMLVYFVPNLVQDFHRIWEHNEGHQKFNVQAGLQFQYQTEKCPVCVFEFNIVDEITNFIYVPLVYAQITLFAENSESQIQNTTFHYYNLRAPPQA